MVQPGVVEEQAPTGHGKTAPKPWPLTFWSTRSSAPPPPLPTAKTGVQLLLAALAACAHNSIVNGAEPKATPGTADAETSGPPAVDALPMGSTHAGVGDGVGEGGRTQETKVTPPSPPLIAADEDAGAPPTKTTAEASVAPTVALTNEEPPPPPPAQAATPPFELPPREPPPPPK